MVWLGIGDAIKSTEGRLPAPDESPKLRLKNGSDVDARRAYVVWQMLGAVETRRPNDLRTLSELARGGEAEVPAETQSDLRERYRDWFTEDGILTSVVREVLLSASRDTVEGSVLVNPFKLLTQQDVDLFTRIQSQDDRFLGRLFGEGGENPSGHSIS